MRARIGKLRNFLTTAPTGAVVVLLSGCLSISRPAEDLAESQLKLPETYAAATQPSPGASAAVRDNWMAEFGDERLVALVEEAIRCNPDLAVAAARWEEARARLAVARSFLWPDLSGNARAERAGTGIPAAPGAPSTVNRYSVAAQVGWELDLWGRLRSDVAAARESADAVALSYEFARQSLAASVAESWFLAIRARQQLAIDRDRLAAEQRTAQVTRDRVQVGAGTQLDAELAEANVSIAAAAVRADEAAIAELVKALEALLGRYPAAELALADDLPNVPGPVPLGVPSELLARRPDIAAADRRVAAAFHFRESARAARLPQVALTASLGSLIDPNERIWSIGSNLLAPIFTGGRLEAEVEIATAQQRQALADYVSVAIEAFREVETALANEQYFALRQAELEHATARSRNASRIAEDRYDAGIISIIELMVTRRQDFEIRSVLLQVRTDRLRQRLTLYRALGGSFNDERITVTSEGGVQSNEAGVVR